VDTGRAAGGPADDVVLAGAQPPGPAGQPGAGTASRSILRQRLILVLGIVVFAASVGTWAGLHLVSPSLQSGMLDLQVYRWGGLIARHSGDLYGAHFPYHHLRFTYTPAAALVFAGMSAMPWLSLELLSALAGIASLTAVMWLTWGLLGYRRPAGRAAAALIAAGVAVWLGPVQQTLDLGQVNLVLMLLVLADLSLPDSARFKGIGLGLAAGFKLTPLIFVLYLLLTRRFRAAAVALSTFAATIAVSLVLLPGQAREFWFGGLFLNSRRTGNNAYVGNQSLHGMLARLVGETAASQLPRAALPVLAGLAGVLLAAWWSRRGQEAIGILTCALAGLLASPISWAHHWVWAAPALLVAAEAAAHWPARPGPRRWAAWFGLALLAAPFFIVPQDLVPPSELQGHHLSGLEWLAGNLYVITGLLTLGLIAAARLILDRQANQTPDQTPVVSDQR